MQQQQWWYPIQHPWHHRVDIIQQSASSRISNGKNSGAGGDSGCYCHMEQQLINDK